MNITFLKHHVIYVVCFILCLTILQLPAQYTSETKPEVGTPQKIGDVVLPALPTIPLAISFDLEKGAWQITEPYSATIAPTYRLRYAVNKLKPDGGATDKHSFPSDHTAVAFSSESFFTTTFQEELKVNVNYLFKFIRPLQL